MNQHLKLHWWRYAAVVLISVILWTNLFDLLASPKRTEQLNIIFVGEHLDTSALEADLLATLPDTIQQVSVSTATFDAASYKNKLSSYSVTNDLIIIEESHMAELVGQTIFARLTDGMLRRFPDAVLYEEPVENTMSLPFGFVLCDGSTENNFSAHYSGSESCYLFCSPDSVNFDTLNENGVPGNDAALQAMHYLMEITP